MIRAMLLLGLAACMAMTGCAQRRIIVTSDPPGALVWINDVEVGRTPVEASFLYYGVYDVQVRLEGYKAVNTGMKAAAPWYEYPPFDLAAEASPFPVTTTVKWHFTLTPAEMTETDEEALIERAREMRGRLDETRR